MFLVYLLISGFALFVFVLVVPVGINFTYNNQEEKSRTRITWLFGVVSFDLKENKKTPNKVSKNSVPKIEIIKPIRNSEKRGSMKPFLAVIKSKGFVKRIIRLIREIVAVAEIEHLYCSLGLGLDDPADTGRVYGMLSPAFSFLYACPRVNFSFIPLFDRAALEAEIDAAIRIVPMKFVWAVLRFTFSVENVRAIFAAVKAR